MIAILAFILLFLAVRSCLPVIGIVAILIIIGACL